MYGFLSPCDDIPMETKTSSASCVQHVWMIAFGNICPTWHTTGESFSVRAPSVGWVIGSILFLITDHNRNRFTTPRPWAEIQFVGHVITIKSSLNDFSLVTHHSGSIVTWWSTYSPFEVSDIVIGNCPSTISDGDDEGLGLLLSKGDCVFGRWFNFPPPYGYSVRMCFSSTCCEEGIDKLTTTDYNYLILLSLVTSPV